MDIKGIFSDYSIYKNNSNIIYDEEEKKYKIGIAFFEKIKESENDIFYIIKPEEENRPDIISQKFFGTPHLDWVICIFNHIKDPLKEFTAGKKIVIPSPENISEMLIPLPLGNANIINTFV